MYIYIYLQAAYKCYVMKDNVRHTFIYCSICFSGQFVWEDPAKYCSEMVGNISPPCLLKLSVLLKITFLKIVRMCCFHLVHTCTHGTMLQHHLSI